MLKNKSLQFVCKDVYLTVENRDTIFTNEVNPDKKLKIPVAHGDGNYFADENTLKELVENKQIVFRYSSKNGKLNEKDNPNGSVMNIAGIINKKGNVLGMMPHPERACNSVLSKTDGALIFNSIANSILN
jgi:phosphoribosylformylglycinamidine synthase